VRTTHQRGMMTRTRPRIPLNTFAIGFGLAGLAEVWDAASGSLGLPPVLAQVVWGITSVAWLWLLVAHIVRGAHSSDRLSGQLKHPAQGVIAALVPITTMLIAGEVLTVAPLAGLILFDVSVVASAAFAGWLIGTWLQGGLALESVHGGYLLPTVAAGLVGADVAAKANLTELGWGLFGVGVFFWVVMTVLLIIRLAFRPSLPDPLVPTMAILVAPPGVAGIAWFSLTGLHPSPVAAMIAGLGVLLVLVQFALIPKYRRLKFSLGFWSFTFPAAAVLADAILWVRITAPGGWRAITVALLVLATLLVVLIGIRSLADVLPRGRRAADEKVLRAADETDAR
jgi:tellurite resistance protein